MEPDKLLFGRQSGCSRRRFLSAFLSGAATWLFDFSARADEDAGNDFVVIAHPDNTTGPASRDFLQRAFLKRTTEWRDGESIKPVDQRPDTQVRIRFSKEVLGRSVAAVKSYWQQRIFSGRGVPPPELESDQAVVEYVLKHRGAIGYVSVKADVKGAKTIASG